MTALHTRVAPSPTGFFHLGTARTALHNYLIAKATGGHFLLRIDDTDLQRNQQAYIDVIFDALQWLDIVPDSVMYQSQRFSHYQQVADQLIRHGLAVRDKDNVVRLAFGQHYRSSWHDFYGKIYPLTDKDRDMAANIALMKSDGTPTYHFSCVVDDVDTQRNLVLRGADHIPNTVKQLYIADALQSMHYGITDIQYIHVGLIMKDQKKLSKRDGASNILAYRDQGYHPMALWNFLLRLGWGHPDPNFDRKTPLLNKDDMINRVMDGKFKVINANFDNQKLAFYAKKLR